MSAYQSRPYTTLEEGQSLHEIETEDGRVFYVRHVIDYGQFIALWDEEIESALEGVAQGDEYTAEEAIRELIFREDSGPLTEDAA